MTAGSFGERRKRSTPVRSARSRCSAYGPASATLSSSFFCGARHIASGVSARIVFSAPNAASRLPRRGVDRQHFPDEQTRTDRAAATAARRRTLLRARPSSALQTGQLAHRQANLDRVLI